jgi:leucyl aminopeptidase (aminopeptidase T)
MHRLLLPIMLATIALLVPISSNSQGEDQNQQLATKLVTNVLHAKTGDIVVIFADSTRMALVEDLYLSLRHIGAFAITDIGSNRLNKLYYQRVPGKYDAQPPNDSLALARVATSFISIDYPYDPSVTAGVPAARLNVMSDANYAFSAYVLKHNIPIINIGNGILPSAATAATYGVPEDTLSTVFWDGMNADYDQIHRDAAKMSAISNGSHTIHVTASNGTDITFRTLPGAVILNDGSISAADQQKGGAAVQKQLPAGDVYVRPDPQSARGTIVFGTTKYNGVNVAGMRVHVANGKVISMNAASGGSVVQQFYASSSPGRDRFGWADFGVNRSMTLGPGNWGAGPSMAAGFVTMGIGGDLTQGGSNHTSFLFASFVPNATVTVDGKPLISSGRLTL